MISNLLSAALAELQSKDAMFFASSIAALFSLSGAFLNARQKWYSFLVWGVANMFWLVYDFVIGAYFQSALFACYLFTNIYGLYCWKFKNTDNESNNMIEKINSAINEYIRPMLQADGGDITVVNVDGYQVFVKLQGACSCCPNAMATLKGGVEHTLKTIVDPNIEVVAA